MAVCKKLLTRVLIMAITGGALAGTSAHAVRLSETGAGGVLLGPVYLAGAAGYDTTTVRVVNPSSVDAIKAKVSLRSRMNSELCRDFLLYLSPGDVATFDISAYMRDANGNHVGLAPAGRVQIWSNDDSLLSSRSTAAPFATFGSQPGAALNILSVSTAEDTSAQPPMRLTQAGDTCQMGHIEVVGVYAARGTVGTPGGNVTINSNSNSATSKFDLLRIFDSSAPAPIGFDRSQLTGDVTGNAGASGDYSSRVKLAGTVEIRNPASGDTLFYPMVALRDGINPATGGVSTPLVANALFDTSVYGELALGQGMGELGSDNLADIEGALVGAASSHYGLYRNGEGGVYTNLLMTFPTRYRHRTNYPTAPAAYSAPFYANGAVGYAMMTWDMQENRTQAPSAGVCVLAPCPVAASMSFMTDEVNYLFASTQYFTSGWHDITLTGTTGAADIPAMGFTHAYSIQNGQLGGSRLQMLYRP